MSGICCLKFQVKFLVLQSLNFINVPQRVYCERMSSGTVCCTAAAATFSPFSSLFSVLHGEAHSFGNAYWKIDFLYTMGSWRKHLIRRGHLSVVYDQALGAIKTAAPTTEPQP